MLGLFGPRVAGALAIAVLAALATLLLGAGLSTALVVLVIAVGGVLLAAGEAPPPPSDTIAARAPVGPDADSVIEAIIEPVLIVSGNRTTFANQAALDLLGQHILDEDVRVAIRHPAAAEWLTDDHETERNAPILLSGLGTRDQRWEMHVRRLGEGRRLIQLIDSSGSHATERMRVDFVANASHELRTPLASLLGFIETLRDGAGDDPDVRDRFLKVMQDEAVRIQRVVDDLMSLSRIEAEKHRTPSEPIDLAQLIEQVRAELAAIHPVRGRDLVTEVASLQPIVGDRGQLSQLLHNIVGNAMKYGRTGEPVTVSLRRSGDRMVSLQVSDVGDGIPSEHLPRLTERFYRVDAGRSRSLGGTGLGLAIVKHIVERHRGRLDIASTVGKGTTVTVLLPSNTVIKA